MSYGSLTLAGKVEIAKLMKTNFQYYIALGVKPDDYIDTWGVDEGAPAYISKKIVDEEIIKSDQAEGETLVNTDIRSIIEIYTPSISAQGILNGYLEIIAQPGTQGNITVRLQPGGIAGSETVSFNQGVLTVNIENGKSTRTNVRQALLTSSLILSINILSNPLLPITLAVDSDTVNLTGGANTKQFMENEHFKVGYLDNENGVSLGKIKWIETSHKPQTGQKYYVSYWAKELLSKQQSLLQAIGFKKAISVDYVLEDDNGAIITSDKKWSISNMPTRNILLKFFINNLDVPNGTVIRQHGIYINSTPINDLGTDHFYTLDQLQNQGTLLHLENISAYRHEIIVGTTFNLVISI